MSLRWTVLVALVLLVGVMIYGQLQFNAMLKSGEIKRT